MALKQKNASEDFSARLQQKLDKSNNEGRVGEAPARMAEDLTDGLTKEALELARKAMKKKTRVHQRSLKLDDKVNTWLDRVKDYQKKELGIVRPCLDDLMYDAIVEYLGRHYEELEP